MRWRSIASLGSEDDVVDEARRADAAGHRNDRSAFELVDRVESLGLHDRNIVRRNTRMERECLVHERLDGGGGALAGGERVAGPEKGATQAECLAACLRIEIDVP